MGASGHLAMCLSFEYLSRDLDAAGNENGGIWLTGGAGVTSASRVGLQTEHACRIPWVGGVSGHRVWSPCRNACLWDPDTDTAGGQAPARVALLKGSPTPAFSLAWCSPAGVPQATDFG